MLNYPLTLRFKAIAFHPQVTVDDAAGRTVAFARKKAFDLKEDIAVFDGPGMERPLFRIRADRIFDMGARYAIAGPDGATIGALQAQGMGTWLHASYAVADAAGAEIGSVREEKAWVKWADELLSQVPFLDMLSGYLFHPAYLFARDGHTVLRLQKEAAMLEGRFRLERQAEVPEEDEPLLLASAIAVVMLQRQRG